jgi:hypothetical protein
MQRRNKHTRKDKKTGFFIREKISLEPKHPIKTDAFSVLLL